MSVTHDTTIIEIAATGKAAGMRWVPTTETAAVAPAGSVVTGAAGTENFDHMIAEGTVRRFAIPIEAIPTATFEQSVQGVNRAQGLYERFAVISVGIGSVYSTEY